MKEFAPYYFTIYWVVVMLLTVSKYGEMQCLPGYSVLYRRDSYKLIILFSIFYVLFFGFRPVTMSFGDTVIYNTSYNMLQTYGTFDAEGSTSMDYDWLFYTFMAFCAQIMDVYYFFAIVMCFYIVMMFVGCIKMDAWHGATLMLFCIGAFSFYGYSVNGIRNGVACSFVIMALGGMCKGERIWPIILSFVAIGCHKSVALPLVCMYFTYFIKNPKLMYLTWLGAIAMSLVFGETIGNLFSLLNYDDRLAQNMQNGEDVALEWGEELEARFRWDFLLYSFMPILLGAYTLFVRKIYNNTYLLLLGTYIYANSFWVLVIRGLFSNRFAYLSWFIYPIVLAYPLLNLPVFVKNHSKKTAWILMAHIGFTTMMWMFGKL